MRTFICLLLFSVLLSGCNKPVVEPEKTDPPDPEKDYKLKTETTYPNSRDTSRSTVTTFTYDAQWNLTKKLTSSFNQLLSAYTYEYSDDNKLSDMKFWAYSGQMKPDIKESDLLLRYECRYSYISNKKIEMRYSGNKLTDSTVYTYKGQLLIDELSHRLNSSDIKHVLYSYDSKDRLLKVTDSISSVGLFSYTDYVYQDSQLYQERQQMVFDNYLIVKTYTYSTVENKRITEVHNEDPYGDYLSERITYQDDKKIEYIKYHPTFPGQEWYCVRYEYYE